MSNKIPNEIGLGEFIAKVKEDLKPTEDSPIFFLEKVELEIHVTVSQEVSGEAKAKADLKINVLGADFLKFGEAEVGGKASGIIQKQAVHTIKATLSPIFTNEEMKSGLSKEELDEIRAKSISKIFRGEKEDEKPSLSEEKSKKRFRG